MIPAVGRMLFVPDETVDPEVRHVDLECIGSGPQGLADVHFKWLVPKSAERLPIEPHLGDHGDLTEVQPDPLVLLQECGAEVPDHALLGALRHFYRYAGRGNNPYGDDRPYTGFVDNGKNGLLAFSMAAAANLTPNGEDSVYARARDICAMKGFYLTTYMLHGHTGGGIGEIWRSAAMGLLHETKPAQYREFMDKRRWHYDLSRRHDGSFGILGGGGYDKEQWGVAFPLAYTMPRKTLRCS